MCYQPISILNPTRDFYPFDSYRIDADCGECVECRFRRQTAWSLRSYYELVNRDKSKYLNVFFTLTYSDAFLPHFIANIDSKYYKVATFSREHLRKFFHSLRKRLFDKFGITDISYLACCEYGDQYQRPHYHVLLSVPYGFIDIHYQLDVPKLHELIKNAWSYWKMNISYDLVPKVRVIKLVEKKTFERIPYGWVLPDINFALTGGFDRRGKYHQPLELVSPMKASKYASKYTCKDISFFKVPEVNELVTKWKRVKHNPHDPQYLKLKQFASSTPFIYASRGFGEVLVDMVKNDALNTPLNCLIHGIQTPFSDKRIQLPPYIKRKLVSKVHYVPDPIDEDKKLVRYEMTDLGYQLKIYNKRAMFEASCTEFTLFYKYVKNSRAFCTWCKLNSVNLAHVKDFIPDDLALYNCFYRNKILPSEINDLFTLPMDCAIPEYNCDISDLYEFADAFYESNLIKGIKYVNPNISSRWLERTKCRFNYFKCFQGMDEFISIFNRYKFSQQKEFCEKKQKEKDDRHRLRNSHYNIF